MKRSNIVFLFVVTIFLALPAGFEPNHFAKALFTGAFLHTFSYAFLLTLLVHRRMLLKRAICTLLYLFFCVECFLYLRFGSRFDPNLLTMMLQTTTSEMQEFISVYMASSFTFIFFFFALSGYMLLYRMLDYGLDKEFRIAFPIKMLFGMFVVMGFSLPLLSLPFPIGQNTVQRFVASVTFVRERHNEIEKMVTAVDSIKIFQTPEKEGAPILIFVIGESFNKYHSSLYGYHMPTSPYMEKERIAGNLICYTRATSPTNGTDFAMRFLFTLQGCEKSDTIGLKSFVLMPAVFRKAQYKVVYFDNQYTRSSGGSLDYSCGYFLNPSFINNHCFDYRNDKTYAYDGDFIDCYSTDFLKTPKSLNIIHLKGQHFDASKRFPDTFATFTFHDVKRSDLSEEQRQRVADYDNATLYNDYVLKKTIDEFRMENAVVIYLSDHGEHIYDSVHHYYGRGFGATSEEETIKAVFEVPFMVWCSDRFMKENASTYRLIKENATQPLCTADVPFLLFDLAGIDCNYHNRTKSVINPLYQAHDVEFVF